MPYRFECPREGCPFSLVAGADGEVERLARAHARIAHGSRIAPADLERGIERLEAT